MAMSLSDMLNPAPASARDSPRRTEERDVSQIKAQSEVAPATEPSSTAQSTAFKDSLGNTLTHEDAATEASVSCGLDGQDDSHLSMARPSTEGQTDPPNLKIEQPMTPAGKSPTPADPSMDEETLKAIAAAQNEYSTRRAPGKKQDMKAVSPSLEVPKSTVPKKRPAPSKGVSSATSKKNAAQGIKKPPPKKLKLEGSNDQGTPPLSARSITPSKLKPTSKSATPAGSSPAAARSSPMPSEGGVSDASDDAAIYCICRRPDNHTWMIGCDGGCEDWFHGKCIKIKQEDEDLIDKYICPNCETLGKGVTTWKSMCRRPGCRKPARLKKGNPSKYCSNECGIRFFKEMAGRTDTRKAGNVNRKRRSSISDKVHEDASADADVGPLGGPIRPPELKALAYTAMSIDDFRRIGSSALLTPPGTASPDADRKGSSTDVVFMPEEHARLSTIADRKAALCEHRALLKDRERFVVWAKERAAVRIAESKAKSLCGYCKGLSWSNEEFGRWWSNEGGKEMVMSGVKAEPQPAENEEVQGEEGEGKADDGFVCDDGKRCTRHIGWQKLALQDVRFEEADVGDEMRKVDREEVEIRERARMRAKVASGAQAVEEGDIGESKSDVVMAED